MFHWTQRVEALVDSIVDFAHEKAVRPSYRVARAIVAGLFVAIVGLLSLILFTVLIFRLLSLELPAWAAYFTFAGICLGGGLLAWSKRFPKGWKPEV